MKKTTLRKSIALSAITASAALLAACNIFNPTGSGSSKNENDAAALQDKAYSYYRGAKYEEALEYFDKAIAEDSSRSEAYLGAAKSAMAIQHVNAFTLLGELKDYNNDVPFLNMQGEELERNHKGITEALKYIRILHYRDSLTQEHPILGLSDRRLRYESIAAGHSILETAIPFLNFSKKTENLGQIFEKKDGKVSANLYSIYSLGKDDTTSTQEFNEAIDALSKDLGNISTIDQFESILEQAGINLGDDDNEASVANSLRSNIFQAQAMMVSYKIRNRVDDDGDGCIDEEIFDYQDNDGDGLYDEDLRITDVTRESEDSEDPGFKIIYSIAPANIDHNMDGIVDGDDEMNFAENSKLLKYASDPKFFKVKGNALEEAKSKVVLDIDPENIQYDLKWRQDSIGGCWTNYTQDMFMQWFEGRN